MSSEGKTKDSMPHWATNAVPVVRSDGTVMAVRMRDSQGQDWEIPLEGVGTVYAPAPDRPAPRTPRERAEHKLRGEWERLNADEVEKVVPKAIEYGAADLALMGYAMKVLLNSPRARQRDWSESECKELACWFYTLGKVARMLGAYERGEMPSDDQPHDVGVYMRMIQILRREGTWPPGWEHFVGEVDSIG